ncbi:hypothetical protein Nmel_018267 [Mimus melanotis]
MKCLSTVLTLLSTDSFCPRLVSLVFIFLQGCPYWWLCRWRVKALLYLNPFPHWAHW